MNQSQIAELAGMTPGELNAFAVLVVLAEDGIITEESDIHRWGDVYSHLVEAFDLMEGARLLDEEFGHQESK